MLSIIVTISFEKKCFILLISGSVFYIQFILKFSYKKLLVEYFKYTKGCAKNINLSSR